MKTEKEEIRQVLITTAREAFLEKGYKAVSMREISEKSGVGLSNIYNYFDSKDELFKVCLLYTSVPLTSRLSRARVSP